MKPQIVLVAMSGGVDSSVAALLMKQKGYNVVGAFMKNWSSTKHSVSGECNWKEERRYASQIASLLGIKLITLDFEKQYRKTVVNQMIKLYKKGITPNPDVDCNNKIKFPLLWKAAQKLKANFIVTGHYAQIKVIDKKTGKEIKQDKINRTIKLKKSLSINKLKKREVLSEGGLRATNPEQSEDNFTFQLLRAKDENKDQSYFLYRLTEKDLSHTLFPIGQLTKSEVREIAKKHKFPNAEKKSTTGICFIGKVNLKDFLKQKIKPKNGKILNPDGETIGTHDGVYYYTIGQRLGSRFGIEIDKEKHDENKQQMSKWYVAKKNTKQNTLTVAPEGHKILLRKEFEIKDIHIIDNDRNSKDKNVEQNILAISHKGGRKFSEENLGGHQLANFKENFPKQINVRIRQVGELLPAKIIKNKITLKKPITGISEGQACVIYKKNSKKVLGGGVISFKHTNNYKLK